MHNNKKSLRDVVPINEATKVLPTDYTAEGVSEFPTEAMRQHNNYHRNIFAPLVKNDEYDPHDEYDRPHYFDSERQETRHRDMFYAKHGLRRMNIDDVEEKPEEMARYLNIMKDNFPDHFMHFNHAPMNKETNDMLSQHIEHGSNKVN